ncbi:MAG: hypothetical protein ACREF5_03460 [Candidatus Saccharimonadales bacterium]
MSPSNDLNSFFEKVMHISVLRMGGAFAGILGNAGADSDVLNDLKKQTIIFVREYHKPTPNWDELVRLSQKMIGYLEVLQLTNTLSEEESGNLINELQKLTSKPSNRS